MHHAAISIHAPRVGSDLTCTQPRSGESNFNPRPPRGERQLSRAGADNLPQFQSTPPAWGATHSVSAIIYVVFISIHAPPCGERRGLYDIRYSKPKISIHAPPCGERPLIDTSFTPRVVFQSTPPVWGATPINAAYIMQKVISIHAPRVGSDTAA